MTVTPEVKQGVEEVRASFPGHVVEVVDEAQGGAYVVIRDLPIGGKYIPSTTWLGFLIPFQYPRADVYPHFVDASIVRVDNKGHGGGISGRMDWQNRSALQISRKSNHWDAASDTAALKTVKVLEWFIAQ